MSANGITRYSHDHPCPICHGYPQLPPGHGTRCAGFVSSETGLAHCTRPERAGALHETGANPPTFAHRMAGECGCGLEHGPTAAVTSSNGHSGLATVVAKREYVIRNLAGEAVATHRRIEYSDGGKSMPWAGSDVDPKDLLYGAECLAALPVRAPVVCCEGEKSADALRTIAGAGMGVVATVCGASSTPSRVALSMLDGRRVWLWPDHDEPGRKHMEAVAGLLRGQVAELRVIAWGEHAKDDAADFVSGGGDMDALRALCQDAEPFRVPVDVIKGPRFFTIAEARKRNSEHLEHLPVLGSEGYIVKGWTHLLAGWWRLGKSELMTAVIAPWMRLGNRVLWITEEPESLWADRADLFDEIYQPVPWERLTLLDAMSAPAPELLESAVGVEVDVVIADTIREVCGIESMKDDDAVRRAVTPWLRRLRDGRRTLIFLAQHRKGNGESGERIEGSVALPSMMDSVLELAAVPGYDRRRKLSVRRRGTQVRPLLYEMDEDDRLVVIPDGRSRGRVETEAAALFAVNSSTVPMTSAEVRGRMTPRPAREPLRRALNALAMAGRIRREPPFTEDAGRRTVTWESVP